MEEEQKDEEEENDDDEERRTRKRRLNGCLGFTLRFEAKGGGTTERWMERRWDEEE